MMSNVWKKMGLCLMAVAVFVPFHNANAQDAQEPVPRLIRFVNTMDSPVQLHFVGENEETELHSEIAASNQVDQETFVGQRWVIMSGDARIAEYFVGEAEKQFTDPDSKAVVDQVVDIQTLKSWQQKVEIVFSNTTEDELDILWIDANGVERVYAIELPPGKAYIQSDANPRESWTVRRHGELMAEYTADNAEKQFIDLKALIEKTKNRVAVAFQNTTDKNVDVLWIDQNNNPVFYAVDIPPGNQHVQVANPGEQWQVQSDGIVIGNYVVLKEKQPQFVDIGAMRGAQK